MDSPLHLHSNDPSFLRGGVLDLADFTPLLAPELCRARWLNLSLAIPFNATTQRKNRNRASILGFWRLRCLRRLRKLRLLRHIRCVET